MEREFDSRALLHQTGVYSFKETKTTEAYRRLMNTDTLDLELEDRLHGVLEERGVELYTKEYDVAVRELQDEYLREKVGYVETNYDFKTGQPCGASHISASYKCRIGGFDLSAATSEEDNKKLAKKVEAFNEAISGLSSAEQKGYTDCVNQAITECNRFVDEGKKVKAYGRILDNGKVLAEDGPPTKILSKTGDEQTMSDKIQPRLSKTGNMAWKDPEIGVSYTKHGKGQTELEQNRESINNNLQDGRVSAAIKHYEKYQQTPSLQAKGEFGSPAVAKQREPSEKEVDAKWKSLSKEEKARVAWSGVDSVGGRRLPNGEIDQRSEHRAFYERNPDLLEARGKDVLAAYLSQSSAPGKTPVSAFTGKDIPLPGTFGPGGKSVVDHYSPLSKAYPSDRKNQWSREAGLDVMRKADSRGNIVIVEGGLNHSKGNRENWKTITGGWERKVKEYEKNATKAEKLPTFSRRSGGGASTPMEKTRTKVGNVAGTTSKSRVKKDKPASSRKRASKKEEPKKAPSKQPSKSEALKNLEDRVKQLKKQGLSSGQIKDQLKGTLQYLNDEQRGSIGL